MPDLHYFSPSPPARYHHHHYRWENGGSMRLRNSPTEKAKPRYRLREDPAPVPHQPPCRLLCLHLPAGLPSVPPEPACPSLGMLGQSHHPSPWELGLDLCPRHPRVLPAKCQALVFQPCFLTAKASGSGISLMVSPDGSSQGHVTSLCWG